jgi:hypothetical protein
MAPSYPLQATVFLYEESIVNVHVTASLIDKMKRKASDLALQMKHLISVSTKTFRTEMKNRL